MKSMILLATAALALCGCSAHAARDPAPAVAANVNAALDGTNWKFVEVAGAAVPANVIATLRLKDGRAFGKAGCNAYGASYQIAADGTAHFKQGMSTKMACLQPAGVMRVEHGVFQALQHTVRVERSGANLTLFDAVGKPLATLVRSDMP
jgi:heat shock protein HslJ